MSVPIACRQPASATRSEFYEQIVSELSEFAVFITDPDRCIASWNPGVERILGYPEADWLEQSIDIIFTPEDRDSGAPQKECEAALASGRAADNRWHLRKDGSRVFVDGVFLALRDHSGTLLGYAKAIRDLTEIKRREQNLEHALAYSVSITETIREPVLVLDRSLRVLSANRSFCQTFLTSPELTEGRFLYNLGDGAWNIHRLRNLLEQILPREATVENFEVDHVFPGIGHKVMLLNARKLWREGDHTELLLLAFEDVTLRRKAERDLGASEKRQAILAELGERLRGLNDIASLTRTAVELVAKGLEVDLAGFGTVDATGTGTSVENSWSSGRIPPFDGTWCLAEFGEQLVEQLLRGETVIIPDTAHDPLTAGKESRWADLNVRASLNVPLLKDGSFTAFFFLNHSEPKNWTHDEIVFLRKVVDRTWAAVDRERLTGERERLTKELKRSNAELTQFAHIAAHDLQSPLRSIISYSQLLARQASDSLSSDHKEFLDIIINSSRRMQELVQSLLRFAQLGQGTVEKEPVSMQGVWQAVLSNLSSEIREYRALISHDALPTVMGDKVQLTQLLQNLVVNALRYGRPDVLPTITIAAREREKEFVFEVRDNGEGIASQYLLSIFEPLRRLHGGDIPGSGMGLATCSRIVELHGGHIWAESVEGCGSTFCFSLPKPAASSTF